MIRAAVDQADGRIGKPNRLLSWRVATHSSLRIIIGKKWIPTYPHLHRQPRLHPPIVLGEGAVPVLREVIVDTAGLRKGCRLSQYEIRNIISRKIAPVAEGSSLPIFVILGSIEAGIGTAEVQFVVAFDPSHVFL